MVPQTAKNMHKWFLLIGKSHFGHGIWQGCYETVEIAENQVYNLREDDGMVFECWINGKRFDKYEIIDLRNWVCSASIGK